MSVTWNGAEPPAVPSAGPIQTLRMMLRATILIFVTYFGMIFVVLFNLIERIAPLGVAHRITCLWGRICLSLCGLRLQAVGTPMTHHGAIVSNHAGWIDIFTLLTADRVYFVSKAEVARWPVVGILSRQIGTLYIERRRSATKVQAGQMADRLRAGDRLCFFPEGTSTDGRRVLPFRTALFSGLMDEDLRDEIWVQPVTLDYRPAAGLPDAFYGWWGDMGLGPHLKAVFALSSGGVVRVVHHPPLRVADFQDRKALARACEQAVRSGLDS